MRIFTKKYTILHVTPKVSEVAKLQQALGKEYGVVAFGSWSKAIDWLTNTTTPVHLIITDMFFPVCPALRYLKIIRRKFSKTELPFIIYAAEQLNVFVKEAQRLEVNDFYRSPLDYEKLTTRIESLIRLGQAKSVPGQGKQKARTQVRLSKRIFDIVVASVALLLLSPILAVAAICIRLESPGSIFYTSKRVGQGFRTFNLYKFRSMYSKADKQVDQLQHLNMYKRSEEFQPNDCPKCEELGTYCSPLLYKDNQMTCEYLYNQRREQEEQGVFVKFENDPRITRIGHFLRNTSLDELPQLLNILKGDMSLVGNRPLPLYEAEKLTRDEALQRFLTPAGLTGLWQVTKRGTKDLSAEERIQLDTQYAKKQSLWLDFKIILKTFPALLQKEKM